MKPTDGREVEHEDAVVNDLGVEGGRELNDNCDVADGHEEDEDEVDGWQP